MLSIKSLTKLSVLIFFCFELFMGSLAFPIAEKAYQQESKNIEPRGLFGKHSGASTSGQVGQVEDPLKPKRKSGKAVPFIGGALLAGGAVLAYEKLHKGSGSDASA